MSTPRQARADQPDRMGGPHVNASRVYALRNEDMGADELRAVTAVDVGDAVTLIEAKANSIDPEGETEAQRMEWFLYRNVLRAIEAGHPNAAGLARVALRVERIGFVRWFG